MTPNCPCCGQTLPESINNIEIVLAGDLSPTHQIIMRRLAKEPGHWVANADLLDAMYGNRPSGGPEYAQQVLRVQVHHLKKKLAPYLLGIEQKVGFRMLVGRQ